MKTFVDLWVKYPWPISLLIVAVLAAVQEVLEEVL